ncbi:MAG: protein kinase [Pseudomonadota bacterium]
MDFVGRKLGRYDIVELIGEGGMARVYKAFDPEINRSVALKILKEEHCQTDEYKNRFIKEGRAAGALTHPNIVTIYDVGTIDDAPYIMMELLEGTTLGELLQDGERLTPEQTLECVAQLADALDYAHKRQIVHRDMKPDNVIMDLETGVVKIADFGIARLAQSEVNDSTQAGMMLGTPRYMSPEQATGDRVDGRSDLFAIGVIMYEIITGRKAFDADSMTTLILQIVQKDPVPIRQTVADAPVGFEKIVKKLLQKKPERRFQTGAELKTAVLRELGALRDANEESAGYLPLQIKWTAIMAVVVAVAMAASSYFVIKAQRSMLSKQLVDSGIALTKFISVQSAIPVLGEDWISLEALVQDAAARDTFSYLVVSDHTGVVRSATDPELLDKPRPSMPDAEEVYRQEDIVVSDVGESLYNFSVPVLFNQTPVGSVDVGLATESISEALATTSRMLIILALAMVVTVSIAVFIFNKLTSRNLYLVTEALRLFARKHHEVRISKASTDEFGDLFVAFNAMADDLQQFFDESDGDRVLDPLESSPVIETDISGITQTVVAARTVVNPGAIADDQAGPHEGQQDDHKEESDSSDAENDDDLVENHGGR